MKRSIFALWLCVVALAVVAGWTLRGAHEQAGRREIAEHLRLCGECFACRAGHVVFCESLEREGFAKAICNPQAQPRGADL